MIGNARSLYSWESRGISVNKRYHCIQESFKKVLSGDLLSSAINI